LQNNRKIKENNDVKKYGNTGCGVFKGDIGMIWLKINGSQIRLLNFEYWSSGELSKIGHHFRKYSDLKIDVIKKMSITKDVLLNSYSSKKAARFG
jgi:hypothetical protein